MLIDATKPTDLRILATETQARLLRGIDGQDAVDVLYAFCVVIASLADLLDAQQAKIDSLMLEHCPEEMTPEQLAEWKAHQQPTERKLN